MSASTLPDWPPKTSAEKQAAISAEAVDFALSHSLIYRPVGRQLPPVSAIHAPFALYPTPFPRQLYDRAKRLQAAYNAVYANIACDQDFLENVIGGAVARVDDFQGRLWQLWEAVRGEGLVQQRQLGLFRSDYLLHQEDGRSLELKQVEFNTIAGSFGPLAGKVTALHRYLVKTQNYPSEKLLKLENIPENHALETLVGGIAAAHKAQAIADAIILFIVQDAERNVFDQKAIQWKLLEDHGIRCQRRTLKQITQSCGLSQERHLQLLDGPNGKEKVAVVYFRAGYTPDDYPSQTEWDARLLLERSNAIKCPSINLQLAGAKKVQQVLAEPGVLERFIPSQFQHQLDELRETFMGMWPMDESTLGKEGQRLALTESYRFVLKPQREGGGNNIYRDKISTALHAMQERDQSKEKKEPREKEGYILMELIKPPQNVHNIMVRAGTGEGVVSEVISELGCYGATLFEFDEQGKKAKIISDISDGHLLRTKGSTDDEGGVAVGFSVIDSPLLV